jgi:hypothetical protein
MSDIDHYYAPEGIVDKDKVAADARARSLGDSRNAPQPVLVHHHSYQSSCMGAPHDKYENGEIVDSWA